MNLEETARRQVVRQVMFLASLFLAISLTGAEVPGAAGERERAVAAMGGLEALNRAASGEVVFEGTFYAREQAFEPSRDLQPVKRRQRLAIDISGRRTVREAELTYPGGIRFFTRAVLLPDGGFQIDLLRWRQGTDITRFDAGQSRSSRLSFERLLPHWALLQHDSDVTLSYHPDATVASATAGATEIRYGDYRRRRDGLMLPGRVQLYAQGNLVEDLAVRRFTPRKLRASELLLPAGYADAPPSPPPAAVDRGHGIWMLENMPAGYRSMFIEQHDHVIVLEAPQQSSYAKVQLELIRSITPKPIKYVVVTHHHGDHTGGLPLFAAEGAVLVVPKGAGEAIRRQFARRSDPEPVIEEVAASRTLGEGVELYEVPNAHVSGNLIVYLRHARTIFQGDLFYVPERGNLPKAFAVSRGLDRAIRLHRLDVETIAGVHGRPATWMEFRRAVRR